MSSTRDKHFLWLQKTVASHLHSEVGDDSSFCWLRVDKWEKALRAGCNPAGTQKK